MAALARYFGQQWDGLGDPHADHAVRWIAERIDPERRSAPTPRPAPLPTAPITLSGATYERPVSTAPDGAVRVADESPIENDGWSSRVTFTGNAADFMALKRRGVMLPSEREAADRDTNNRSLS